MKIAIVMTHPTQFDVPILRLGNNVIEAIYTNIETVKENFDPELQRTLTWNGNSLDGYNYDIVPPKSGIRWLFRKFRTTHYDLVITNGYFNRYLVASLLLGKFFAGKNALRLDTVEYNNKTLTKRLFKKVLYACLNLFVDVFFCVGTLSKNFLISSGVKKSKISTYGYISDNTFFSKTSNTDERERELLRSKLNISEGKKVILCVSKHSLREAPFDTLEAFRLLNDPSLHLLLVGDGPLHDEVKQKSSELGIDNITFAGYVHFSQLPYYYGISDVFVHDSHNEPWGVSVQEAIACGLPVVASDRVGASYDLIMDGQNGFQSKTGDVIDLAKKIELALKLQSEIVHNMNSNMLKSWNYNVTIENIIGKARQ